jgi:WD40 repeat protein
MWNTTTGALINTWENGRRHIPLAISPSGELLATRSDGGFSVWLSEYEIYSSVYCRPLVAAISDDGQLFTIGSWRSDASICNVKTDLQYRLLDDDALFGTIAATFSSDSRLVACTHIGGTVTLWKTDKLQQMGTPKRHSAPLNALALSPDGQLLACSAYDDTISIWDIASDTLLGRLGQLSLAVNDVVFSPDGHILVPAGGGKTVMVWSAKADAAAGTASDGAAAATVCPFGFSADGQRLWAYSPDGTQHDIDVATIRSRGVACPPSTAGARRRDRFTIDEEWLM